MANLQEVLQQYADLASPYAINLNTRVIRDPNGFTQRGGFAVVYAGTLRPDGNRVAIKTACGAPPSDEAAIRRILKEVHLWHKLDHENIIPVLGITTEIESTLSIVSPCMEKGNACNYVKNVTNDPRPLMRGIAQGLYYLHTRQGGAVFHGDLKGSNVLISDSGQALLADFGLSHLDNSSFNMSVSSALGWTVFWTAPEILNEGRKSAAADIWSFGMTLLELFTRERPFHLLKSATVGIRICSGQKPARPSLEETCSRLTDPWWSICCKCWEDEPALRPTIADVLTDIMNIY